MSEETRSVDQKGVDDLYDESLHWQLNTGDQAIYPKRMSGRFRKWKWLTASVWLIFFLGPYLRWGERQAVLFDIPNREFHIFDITILPQDIWMLSLTLLFFAILLAVVTSIAGRVFCGFFCFQTVWTDVFMLIEEKFEGNPSKRRKLDKGPWNGEKIRKKGGKWFLWLLISMLTGLSFAAWFTDAFQLWHDYLTLQASTVAWSVLALFTAGTLLLAGFMREQVCFWLCPYARIQSVMYDKETVLPAYDFNRGEPRGKLKKGQQEEGRGDCIDCNQCVAVCPTGIDIRQGQQEGCITCALCIDACNSVMDKINKPRGLIRYASLDELSGVPTKKLYQRPRVLVYFTIMAIAAAGILYGLTHLGSLELNVIHERSPLFVRQSDGSIQNKYDIKILNKTDKDAKVQLTVTGIDGLEIRGIEQPLTADRGQVTAYTLFVKAPGEQIDRHRIPVTFRVEAENLEGFADEYESMFFGPR